MTNKKNIYRIINKMDYTKLIIVGGFLGAGKTTILFNAAQKLIKKGLNVGLITNDQAPELVDSTFLSINKMKVDEVSGSCFCCNFNGFSDAIKKMRSDVKPDIIFAEPVGSCTDLSATILQPVKQYLKDEVCLAPFTVLADVSRLNCILNGEDNGGLHQDATYIFRKQLEESDIILINKTESLEEDICSEIIKRTALEFPNSEVYAISAMADKGVDSWLDIVLTEKESGKHLLTDIDYDLYAHGEAVLGWLNGTISLTSEKPVDWNIFVKDLITDLVGKLNRQKIPVGHVKIIAENDEHFFMSNYTGLSDIQFKGDMAKSAEIRLIVNARVETSPDNLDKVVRESIASLTKGYESIIIAWKYLQPGRPNPTYRFGQVL